MPTKRYSTEQIVSTLRQAEEELSRGLRTRAMCKKLGISEQTYRGADYSVEFVPKVKVDIVVADDRLEAVVDAIKTSARTGQIGDAKIFVSSVDQAIRIRTSEAGNYAL